MFQSLLDFEEQGGLLPDSLQQSKQPSGMASVWAYILIVGFHMQLMLVMWLFKHFLRIMNTEVAFSSFITQGHYITVNFFPFQGYPLF